MKKRLICIILGLATVGHAGLSDTSNAADRKSAAQTKTVEDRYKETSNFDVDDKRKESTEKMPAYAGDDRLDSVDLLEFLGADSGDEAEDRSEPDDGYEVELVDDSEQIQAVMLPLDHFNPNEDDGAYVNAAILSFLSMAVYGDFADPDDFQAELEDLLIPMGAIDVETFVDSQGTEGVIVTLDGATIVVFRGTSGEGTDLPYADQLADINDDPFLVEVDDDEMYVHEGFWENADNVFTYISDRVAIAYDNEQKIWVTGHSLGGALATHTALRLHYDEQISIQGLHTFGSPRVGDLAMFAKFSTPNLSGNDLWSATQRWVVDGDPLTTYFYGDYTGIPFVSEYIKYEHVGTTNTIYTDGAGGFKVEPNTGEDKDMKFDLDGYAFDQSGEHMWYFPALVDEMFLSLTELGEFDAADQLWETLKL